MTPTSDEPDVRPSVLRRIEDLEERVSYAEAQSGEREAILDGFAAEGQMSEARPEETPHGSLTVGLSTEETAVALQTMGTGISREAAARHIREHLNRITSRREPRTTANPNPTK